jgi:hypothetical protein
MALVTWDLQIISRGAIACSRVRGLGTEFHLFIAIDDTYGPAGQSRSQYVTGARRTHVAVLFEDDQVNEVRHQIRDLLAYMGELLPHPPKEFHFAEIYNARGHWKEFGGGRNLRLIEAFCNIYSRYGWPVLVQTVDDRTLIEHGIEGLKGVVDGLDLADRNDLSLLLLCMKIKTQLPDVDVPLTIIVDEGKRKSGAIFGSWIFRKWRRYEGRYAASSGEPLLQIADMLAFCINRMTYLSLKEGRSSTDLGFISVFNDMGIKSKDLTRVALPREFTVGQFDEFHGSLRTRRTTFDQ